MLFLPGCYEQCCSYLVVTSDVVLNLVVTSDVVLNLVVTSDIVLTWL